MPATTIAAKAAFAKNASTITVTGSVPTWAANFVSAGPCQNCTVYRLHPWQQSAPKIGTISSWTNAAAPNSTLTISTAAYASKGASDTLLIVSPNTVYDSPTGATPTCGIRAPR